MKFGSLFAGIGGFDLGFEKAGMTSVFQAEKDADCARILAKHFPTTTRYDDVTKCDKLPTVDVLCGGFPCQDLSVAGKREGLAGERSGLWFAFLRIIESNRPGIVVIENVPGLLSSNRGRDFAIIIRGLVQCGYGVAWRILDAQYFGLAQRRKRVFIVGSFGTGRASQILFEPEGVCGDPPTRRKARESAATTTGRNIEGGSQGIAVPEVPTLRRALQERDAKGPDSSTKDGHLIVTGALQDACKAHGHAMTTHQAAESNQLIVAHALSMRHDSSEDGTGRGTPLVVANCFNGYTGGHDDNDAQARHLVPCAYRTTGNDRCFETGDRVGAFNTATDPNQHIVAFHENKAGMLSEAEDIGLRSGASHSYQGVGTSSGVRRLTPIECERLQGFPDGWTATDADGKPVSDSARYRMLGNAVAVPVAEWIGRRIMEATQCL